MRVGKVCSRFILMMIGMSWACTACRQKPVQVPSTAPEVTIMVAQPSQVPITTELVGRISPYLVAQVRARVDGIVHSRDFEEGSDVKIGQLLYTIDPAPYRARYDHAVATLARAQANQVAMKTQLKRYQNLIKARAISQQDYDNAIAAHAQAVADVAAGKAAVRSAQIDLDYTRVLSPISGRIGKSQITKGAYVRANEATLLTQVQTIDPIYVDLKLSTTDWMRLQNETWKNESTTLEVKESASLVKRSKDKASVKVELILEDGATYPLPGKLEFSDTTVDPDTGTILLRARFPNPEYRLLPGMFVRARLSQQHYQSVFLIPQVAVRHDQKGQPIVFVVDAQNKVVNRVLTTLQTSGENWIVSDGLHAKERVIVQGGQKVRVGMEVKAVPMAAASDQSPRS